MTLTIGYNDPGQLLVELGQFKINQFARGEFLNVKFNSDFTSLIVGANGDATRSSRFDRSAKIHFRMLSTATQNAIFASLPVAEKLSVLGGLPLKIVDKLNHKAYSAGVCWLVKPADDPVGSVEGSDREWVLETHNLTTEYTPPVIASNLVAGGVELVQQIAAQMNARFNLPRP